MDNFHGRLVEDAFHIPMIWFWPRIGSSFAVCFCLSFSLYNFQNHFFSIQRFESSHRSNSMSDERFFLQILRWTYFSIIWKCTNHVNRFSFEQRAILSADSLWRSCEHELISIQISLAWLNLRHKECLTDFLSQKKFILDPNLCGL